MRYESWNSPKLFGSTISTPRSNTRTCSGFVSSYTIIFSEPTSTVRRSFVGASHDSSRWIERAVLVADVDERDVEGAGHDRVARDAAQERRPAEPVEEDREVVRGEVAHDADVALVDAEVHPARRAEVELADLAALEPLLGRDDGRRVEERVAGHQHELALAGDLDQLVALLDRRRHRLLDEDVLPGQQRGLGQLVVRRDRGDDADRIDRRSSASTSSKSVTSLARPVAARLARERLLVAIADRRPPRQPSSSHALRRMLGPQ